MVAQYVGATGPLANKQIDSAMGGVLFIDEAYALVKDQSDSYGLESMEVLLKRMEDDRGKFIVIAAGYTKEMEVFLSSNSGLKSRFTDYINFDDYKPDEMFVIFQNMCKKDKLEFGEGFEQAIRNKLSSIYASRGKDFGNARTVRKLFEDIEGNVSTRVLAMQSGEEDMKREIRIWRPEDIAPSEKVVTIDDALKELNELEGLQAVKDAVIKIANTLKAQKLTGETELLSKHFVFNGNPGTGKTTVARIMGNVFKSIGLLPTNKVIETDRSKLIGQHLGETPPLVNQQCDLAMGGILFVDEAYALKEGPQDQYGQEAVNTLLKRMEDDRGKFVVIAAGYTNEMNKFLATNTGFKSRFSDYLSFEDYDAAQMYNIFMSMCKKRKLEFAPGLNEALKERLDKMYASRASDFGNARTVRQLFDKTRENMSNRVIAMQEQGMPEEELKKAILIMQIEDLDMTVR